jgi:hypothetical protein
LSDCFYQFLGGQEATDQHRADFGKSGSTCDFYGKFKPLFVNIEITVTALPPISTAGNPDRNTGKPPRAQITNWQKLSIWAILLVIKLYACLWLA